MKPHLQHEKRNAILRSAAVHALNRRFEHEAGHEAYLVAIMASGDESRGFEVFTADLSAWDEAEVSPIRQFAERLLVDRREDSSIDVSAALPKPAGDARMDDSFLLGVCLVDRLLSKDFVLKDQATGKSRIEGYRTVMVFADQSAASVVTRPEESYRVLMSNAPISQPYMETNLYDPSHLRDYSAFATSESAPFLDLLHLLTVMTGDRASA
jgi:hypothetical protein